MSLVAIVIFAPLLILASALVIGTVVVADLQDRARPRVVSRPAQMPQPRPQPRPVELPRAA